MNTLYNVYMALYIAAYGMILAIIIAAMWPTFKAVVLDPIRWKATATFSRLRLPFAKK